MLKKKTTKKKIVEFARKNNIRKTKGRRSIVEKIASWIPELDSETLLVWRVSTLVFAWSVLTLVLIGCLWM